MKTEQELQMQQLTETHANNLAALKTTIERFESKEGLMQIQVQSFLSSLNQSEAELARCDRKLKIQEQLVLELKKRNTQSPVNSQETALVTQKESTQAAEIVLEFSLSDQLSFKVYIVYKAGFRLEIIACAGRDGGGGGGGSI